MPKGNTVLVVDDCREIVRAHARMLKKHWDVVCAYSAPEAVTKIAEEPIHVVMSDWNMPNGGGERVALAAAGRGIPVVVVSAGVAFHNSLARAHELAHVVLEKPVRLAEIDRALWGALTGGPKRLL